jgi:predicted DCC family thiol-disulfide oxidoreductase YuxK
MAMHRSENKIIVFYDGACPICVRDRRRYERLSGRAGDAIVWFDITDRDRHLRELGIDPERALFELHVKDAQGTIHSSIGAYIVLLKKLPLLWPLAWLIGLPLIRPVLAKIYRRQVEQRLKKSGRLTS